MKLSVLLTCLVFVLGFPLDSQAQFTPVVAKLKAVSYQQLPDGSEIERDRREGSHFRSSLCCRSSDLKKVAAQGKGGLCFRGIGPKISDYPRGRSAVLERKIVD